MSFNWKKTVASIAPVIGSAIGGPFAGIATKFITNALGIPCESDDAAIERAISANPEALVALKKAEFDFKIKLKEVGIKESELVYQDIQSARQREMTVQDYTPSVLGFLITFGFFGILGGIMFFPIPESAKSTLQIMIGSLGTAWIAVVSYYFGSSHKNHVPDKKK